MEDQPGLPRLPNACPPAGTARPAATSRKVAERIWFLLESRVDDHEPSGLERIEDDGDVGNLELGVADVIPVYVELRELAVRVPRILANHRGLRHRLGLP